MSRVLIFGLSGQVGDALLPLLRESRYQITAASRSEKPKEENIIWQLTGFENFSVDQEPYDALISLGPLDAFSHWLALSNIKTKKIIALSSTSIITKKNSPDPDERSLSKILGDSEHCLSGYAEKTDSSLIVLRPTLIYGAGRDQSLSRWLAMAKRLKFVVLPIHAGGLRQPVHVSDVAQAVFRSISLENKGTLIITVAGGETLPFDQMLMRTLQVHRPKTKLLRIPNFLFRFVVRLMPLLGMGRGLGVGFFARLKEDWVFDVLEAEQRLGYRMRPFSP